MPPISLRFVVYILLLSATQYSVLIRARHIGHHHRLHRHHHARQLVTPIFTPAPTASIPTSTVMDANALVSDIHEIQDGLSKLPGDLLKFINAIDQRMQDLEAMLARLLLSLPPISPPLSPLPPAEFLTEIMPIPAPTSSTSMCHPRTSAGSVVPCPSKDTDETTERTFDATMSAARYVPIDQSRAVPWNATYPLPTPPPADGVVYTTPDNTITIAPATPVPSETAYVFNAEASDNVAVYYGQTPTTQAGGLTTLCENENVDIAILAFVFDFFGPNRYPQISFGPGCLAPNPAQGADAPGLADCTELAGEIVACQQLGKKVLISLGGYIANSSFASDQEAEQFAQTLWDLFGAGTGDNPDLRPFGSDVIVDGFDIDNENHNIEHYETFAYALRQLFAQDTNKTFYLSAAPQCPMPDESIPMGAMLNADFVWVQFYNNPQCNLDSPGFQASFAAWSANLTSSTPGRPRLYIGAPGFAGAGSGYVTGSGLSSTVSLARELYVENLGGIMLWDGSEAMANMDQYGVDYLEYAKSALQS